MVWRRLKSLLWAVTASQLLVGDYTVVDGTRSLILNSEDRHTPADGCPDAPHSSAASPHSSNALKGVNVLGVFATTSPTAPLVIWNVRRALPSVPIQIFYSMDSADAVRQWFDGVSGITIEPLPAPYADSMGSKPDAYQLISTLFTDEIFWSAVRGTHVLTIQPDTWICAAEGTAAARLADFVQANFSFIGALWPASLTTDHDFSSVRVGESRCESVRSLYLYLVVSESGVRATTPTLPPQNKTKSARARRAILGRAMGLVDR